MDVESKLGALGRRIGQWTPETGFTAISLDYSPADIIFGNRIAATIKATPKHQQNASKVMLKIREQLAVDTAFNEWFKSTKISKMQEIIEFCYFRTPVLC